jgi:hypothetical protein
MSGFDDRLKGFEAKLSHDSELQFKVNARRDRILGMWAAEKLGITGEAAMDYAAAVVLSDLEKPVDDDVVEKVLGDFKKHGVLLDESTLRAELERCHHQAKLQLADESR